MAEVQGIASTSLTKSFRPESPWAYITVVELVFAFPNMIKSLVLFLTLGVIRFDFK